MSSPSHSATRAKRFPRVLVLLVLLLAVAPIGRFADPLVEWRWADSALDRSLELAQTVQSAFTTFQNETLEDLRRAVPSETLRAALVGRNDSTPAALFDLLASRTPGDLTIEVFGRARRILAWSGTEGPETDTSYFADSLRSFVSQGPIYSVLVIVAPIGGEGPTLGYLVAKRLLDVNYPISNRFITKEAFHATFPSRLPQGVRFDFSADSNPSGDSTLLSIPLENLQRGRAGYAFVQKPQRAVRSEEVRNRLETAQAVLLSIGVAWLVAMAFRRLRAVTSFLLQGTLLTLIIWGFRYLLLWWGMPSRLISTDLFEPRYFASPFAAGAAGTLGEMVITAVALFLNVVLVARLARHRLSTSPPTGVRGGGVWRKLRAFAAVVASVAFLLLALRGFAALIHSAVFDSALPYNDPTSVFPSFPMSVMLTTLFLAALSLLLAGGMLVVAVCRGIMTTFPRLREGVILYLLTFSVIAAGSILFGIAVEHPLMGQPARMAAAGLIAVAGLWGWRLLLRGTVRASAEAGWVLVGAALVLLIPMLDDKVHELDRTHVEVLGSEIVRPEDSWLTFVVNRALDDLSSPGVTALLESPDSTDVEKLAFTQWAKSILSREGNNCAVTYTRPDGTVVSDFHIGVPPHRRWEHAVPIPALGRNVEMEERAQNGETVKWYTGSLPLLGREGRPVGVVWVELTGNRQSLLRGEAPGILRSGTKEQSESHYRTLVLSEYFHGRLVSTSNENFSLDRPFPAEALRAASPEGGTWVQEVVDGASFETYFLKDPKGGPDSWIALSLESLDLRWNLYAFVRYALFYASTLLAALLIALLARVMSGRALRPTVRVKLLSAFIVVSLIPVVILAYTNRQYAVDRALATITQTLSAQTAQVASEIQRQLGMNLPVALGQLSDELCVEIASDLNTDFNIFAGTSLQASSKPEMFAAELLDARLSGPACVNLLFRKKAFYTEQKSIGLVPYIVGYRAIVGENGSLIGVVSVPTLYRQTDIDEELARRNVFLYGAYAIALLLSVVAGTVFASQLSAPIRRLKTATERIAQGDLEVELEEGRSDELGELEQVFKKMTLDLRSAQERMMRTERELAWREMAKQVAHEIKNPLTPIKLSIQHLRQAYHDAAVDFGEVLRQVTTTILEQIDALSRIASEFSAFARMPEPRLQRCEVHEVVEEAKSLFQQQTGITFRVSLEARSSIVSADRDALRRAFINILRNSVQAMNEQGLIVITSADEGSMLALRFTDHGPGIGEEAKKHLFEPSFSTKTDGMGLGLAMVRKTVTEIGGDIAITSTPGMGTTVLIRLPAVTPHLS